MAWQCPSCGSEETTVIHSKPADYKDFDARRRNKTCLACGYKYVTFELSVADLATLGAKYYDPQTDACE